MRCDTLQIRKRARRYDTIRYDTIALKNSNTIRYVWSSQTLQPIRYVTINSYSDDTLRYDLIFNPGPYPLAGPSPSPPSPLLPPPWLGIGRYVTIRLAFQKGRCDTIQFVFHKWQYDTMRYASNPKKSQTTRYETIALTKTVIRYDTIRLKFANAPPDTVRYDSSVFRRYDTVRLRRLIYVYMIYLDD